MTAEEFEQRTFEYGVRILKLGLRLKGIGFRLIDQLVRAGTSVGANVEESHAASSRTDFAHKRDIALRECRESIYWLRLLISAGIIKAALVQELLDEGQQISKILAKGIATIRKSPPPTP